MKSAMIVIAVLAMCLSAVAQAPRNLVQAEILSDWRLGAQSFLVGVHLQIEPGWHVYWKYPGDAGLATSVKWTLPDGFAVSELMWPTPISFEQAGHIEGFGYEDEVVLLARVTPPQDWSGPATIGADVRWLVCETTCVPGKASLQMPIGPADAVQRELVAQWLARVPIAAEAADSPAKIKVATMGLEYRIELSGIGADHVQSIVAPGDGLSVVSNTVAGRSVRVVLHAMEGAKPSTQPTEAVIAWTEAGKQHAASVKLARP